MTSAAIARHVCRVVRFGTRMIKGMHRYPPLFGLIVALMLVPVFAQDQSGSATQFTTFLDELWPQAKAFAFAQYRLWDGHPGTC
jgi:hypothetical protein